MKAIHLHTVGVADCHEAALIEMCVRLADGVTDVASIRTLDLVSVLYDEHATGPADIVGAIRSIADARVPASSAPSRSATASSTGRSKPLARKVS